MIFDVTRFKIITVTGTSYILWLLLNIPYCCWCYLTQIYKEEIKHVCSFSGMGESRTLDHPIQTESRSGGQLFYVGFALRYFCVGLVRQRHVLFLVGMWL